MEPDPEGKEAPTEAGRAAEGREERKRRKKSRWGAETEAGLKVLEGSSQQTQTSDQQSAEPAPAAAATAPSAPPADGGGDASAEPAPKRRRSRWEQQEAKPAPTTQVTAGQIVLPEAIAALVNMHVDPKVVELQAQLKLVSVQASGSAASR